MSNDLTTLDETAPDGATQPGSVLDDHIKQTKDSLKDWAVIEHGLQGRHKFGVGNTAGRPASGGSTPRETGTIYINTETGVLEYWNGSAWISLGAASSDSKNYVFNGDMNIWGAGVSAAPTGWTLSGAGASASQNTTNFKIGTKAVNLVRAAADAQLAQDVSLAFYGAAWWQSKVVTLGAWVRDAGGAEGEIAINDGVGTSTSGKQTLGTTWEWMQVTRTLGAGATKVEVRLRAVTGAGTIQFDGVRLSVGSSVPDYITDEWKGRKAIMQFGDSLQNIPASSTIFMAGGNSTTRVDFAVPFKCIVRNLFYRAEGTPGTAIDVTVQKNQVDTLLTINSTTQEGSNVVNEIEFAKGDDINVELMTNASVDHRYLATVELEEIP